MTAQVFGTAPVQMPTSDSVATTARSRGRDEGKTLGYLNFGVPTEDGEIKRIGFIMLKEGNEAANLLFEMLTDNENPLSIEDLQANLAISFNPTNQTKKISGLAIKRSKSVF